MEELKNRPGKFYIKNIKKLNSEDVLFIMSHVAIVRAEYLYHYDTIEYHGYSKIFERLEPGSLTPEYEIKITCDSSGKRYCEAVKK